MIILAEIFSNNTSKNSVMSLVRVSKAENQKFLRAKSGLKNLFLKPSSIIFYPVFITYEAWAFNEEPALFVKENSAVAYRQNTQTKELFWLIRWDCHT